jgi:hypothetical protein
LIGEGSGGPTFSSSSEAGVSCCSCVLSDMADSRVLFSQSLMDTSGYRASICKGRRLQILNTDRGRVRRHDRGCNAAEFKQRHPKMDILDISSSLLATTSNTPDGCGHPATIAWLPYNLFLSY